MDLLATRRRRLVLFTALYVSEGAPIGFLWWALPPKLRLAGVPVAEITALTAMLVLPWTFKFLWAPIVDTVRTQRWGLRAWIISAQLVMGATLLPLIGLDLERNLAWATQLLLLHAFAAATQDVAIDGLAVRTVAPEERGRLNGWTQVGMLGGRAAFGGGALLLERVLGPGGVVIALVAVTWSSLVLVLLAREPAHVTARAPGEPGVGAKLVAAFSRREAWIGLAFALLSGAGFEAVGAVAGTFLVDRGLSQDDVGAFFSLPAVVAMMGGALLGGVAADRLGRLRAVGSTLALVVAAVVVLATLDLVGASATWLVSGVGFVYLGIGLFVSASYALFMDLTDPRVGATQFSAYMGATNGCEAWSGWAVGRGVERFGYAPSFLAFAGASLCAWPLLAMLRRAAATRARDDAR